MRLPDTVYKVASLLKVATNPEVSEFPKEIDIGLTNICNLRCPFCVNDQIKKKRGFMEESLFRSIVDCICDKFASRPILGLGLFGEDTLHPKFVDFLDYASNKGLKINISTNATKLQETILNAIVSATINSLEISLYTLNRKRYNKIAGRERFDEVLNNAHSFLRMAEKAQFRGKIRLRPFESSSAEMDMYREEFYRKYNALNFERMEPKKKRNWAGYVDVPSLLRGVYVRRPCPFPFSRIVVDWDGEVRLCCQAMLAEDLTVGYIGQHYDLYDLWSGQELSEIRERFRKLDYDCFPSCKNCYDSRRYFSEFISNRVKKVLRLVVTRK